MYCGCLLFFAKGRGGVVYHTQVTALRRCGERDRNGKVPCSRPSGSVWLPLNKESRTERQSRSGIFLCHCGGSPFFISVGL